MRKPIVGAGSVIVALGLLSGCASPSPSVVMYEGDYPSYASLEQLCRESQLVVLATALSDEVREVDLSLPPGDSLEENPSAGVSDAPDPAPFMVVETVTTMSVDQVFKGDAKVGSSIEVGQPGGKLDDVVYVADRFDLAAGTSAVLFLNVWGNDVPSSPLNPSQGAYTVDDSGWLVPQPGNSAVKPSTISIKDGFCG